ncbi:transglutaminase-like domain-containing protein [Hydrogenophaga laconesensis]|uniref:Transglutaminase-like putative cysteine protease n=1 Tax=Hydrogenophaga laconesensis TaxID=1805971 RepID=A0ABU1VGD7_9BURK|nr:transglutaminase family protein [Hydrogenophaga laconesensis]MDR7096543.1 transglutaminase-like putative cysteine protease [Hydrogenophaga laconesensis]
MSTDTPPGPQHLAPTRWIESEHPAVQAFAREHARGDSPRERAISLYLAVRDRLRYDPYRVDMSDTGMSASHALELGYGWCVPKAVLLAAVARAAGIPARLGFADVRNHLSTERLRNTMKTDVFAWHGYTSLWIDGAWRKATPAFNIELCDKFGLLPLEFDGENDSLYHPFDREGRQHMEYVNDHGAFDDLPLARMRAVFSELYPYMLVDVDKVEGDFAVDAAQETGRA